MEDDDFLFRCVFAGLQPCRLSFSNYIEMDHKHGTVVDIAGAMARPK
jgi:hypothetical protein